MPDYQHRMLEMAVEELELADAVTLMLRGGHLLQVVKLSEEGPDGFSFENIHGGRGIVASVCVDGWVTSTY